MVEFMKTHEKNLIYEVQQTIFRYEEHKREFIKGFHASNLECSKGDLKRWVRKFKPVFTDYEKQFFLKHNLFLDYM